MSFEEEIKTFLKNKTTVKKVFDYPKILPETKGIYIYAVPDNNSDIEFLDTTTAKETYKGKSLLYSKNDLAENLTAAIRKFYI